MDKQGYLAALLVGLSLSGPVLAETILPLVDIAEYIDPNVQVSGEPLVGIFAGSGGSAHEQRKIYVYLPTGQRPTHICMHATTNDAVYRSRSEYAVPSTASGVARLNFKTAHDRILKQYEGWSLAVRIYQAEKCDGFMTGLVLPAISDPYRPLDRLTVLVNAGEREVRASLMSDGGEVRIPPVDCEEAPGRQQRFSWICTLRPSERLPSGPYQLRVQVQSSSGRWRSGPVADVALPNMVAGK